MRALYERDGTPKHSGGAARSHLSGEHPLFSIFGMLEGVVLKAHYKDDDDNLSKQWTEYDILEATTREIYRNARLLNLFAGLENGAEVTLAETTGTTDQSLLVVEEEGMVSSLAAQVATPTSAIGLTETYKLNGERVVFGCLYGAKSQPFILGALPHPEAAYGANRAEAPRTIEKINGWTSGVSADGTLAMEHTDGRKIVAASDGSITVSSKSEGAKVVLDSSGAATVTATSVVVEASSIDLGASGLLPTDGLVHGSGIDPFTGTTYFVLGSTSSVVKGSKA